jgi:CubicO group peptidase (beta-lactamase class C family)
VGDGGTGVVWGGWVNASPSPSPTNPGYGYLWWLGDDGSFAARGIFGQLIHIDPASNLVIAMHGMWPEPGGEAYTEHREAFIAAVSREIAARRP